jgi:hypothetical protein
VRALLRCSTASSGTTILSVPSGSTDATIKIVMTQRWGFEGIVST